MRKQLIYIVIRSDGEIRVAKRPRISADEVAVAISLNFPDGWGTVTQSFDIDMPEPPTAEPSEAGSDG